MTQRIFSTMRECVTTPPRFPIGGRWIEGVIEFIASHPHPALVNDDHEWAWYYKVFCFPAHDGITGSDIAMQLYNRPSETLSARGFLHNSRVEEEALAEKLTMIHDPKKVAEGVRRFSTLRECLISTPLFPVGTRWIDACVEFIALPPEYAYGGWDDETGIRWTHEIWIFPANKSVTSIEMAQQLYGESWDLNPDGYRHKRYVNEEEVTTMLGGQS